ncbi:L,D-transpeptidase catalytic domain [Octadecabacter temperatus]|uniref:Putative L,D-transpeptidase YcfS n=1 Tax=Octadecabacter temperatus TaxID=1458307 RepID=A0A0K0Y5P9_9RHOB|nr:L,D-transpeptidase [Octadecabacter temperatus]AKS46250.1 putative L,D-transpeptidase YcfS precursor [Octadecabacter temperatus]SIO10537.1 L,D-transpeptidase catalytic domain [Octadecabacter temperatus]
MQSKRTFILGAAATLATPMLVRAQEAPDRNASSFVTQDWQDHFQSLGRGAILADITSRALHYWGSDGSYRLYPSSVPMTEALTRRGYSQIVRKRVGPTWTPTAAMRVRDPSLPQMMEPGAGNPLGTHAMYLDWPAYLIHGTHDTRKIGRQSSSGCIGLYNEHIAELFSVVQVGTQVRLL